MASTTRPGTRRQPRLLRRPRQFGVVAFLFAVSAAACSTELVPPVTEIVAPAAVGRFVTPTNAGPEHPVRLAIGDDGTVFASDPRINTVIGYRDGRKVVELIDLDGPLGLAVKGNLLFVGNSGRHDVEVYDLASQSYVGVLGAGVAEFSLPNAIAVAPDGAVYVVDSREDLVKVYAPDRTRSATLGGTGAGNGQLRYPIAVAVDARRVVVGERANHRVQLFDRKGQWLRTLGGRPDLSAAALADMRGKFTSVAGVALKGDDIYVLDAAHGHVQRLDSAGTSTGFFGQMGDCRACSGLALDVAIKPDGTLLLSDPDHRRWVTPDEVMP